MSAKRRVIVRCKDCWKDLYIGLEGDKLKHCDFCRGLNTYEHAYSPSRRTKRQESEEEKAK